MNEFGGMLGLDNLKMISAVIEIYAESIYFVIYGKYAELIDIRSDINRYYEANNLNKKMLILKMNSPVINICDNKYDMSGNICNNDNGFEIVLNTSLESVQCSVYAGCGVKDAKSMYVLMTIEKKDNRFVLSYPEFELTDDIYPEELIYREFKKICPKYAKHIKRNTHLMDIAGDEDDILVYACKISNEITTKENLPIKPKMNKQMSTDL